ncbi:MAG: YqaJ viral recombinase family protein [Methylocystis sp.]|nr:YqaJ viral recombinase family protein [Methylocystis sp.]
MSDAVILPPAPAGVDAIPCADDERWRAARAQDVTASVAAALIADHDFATPLSIFAEKTGAGEPNVETPAMRRGKLLEPVAVSILREDHPGWTIRHNDGPERVYYRDAAARIGATPDAIVFDPARGVGIVQIKSVSPRAFKEKWGNEARPEPPLWIAVQAIVEASLVGAEWAAVAPLVIEHGVDLHVIDVPLAHASAIMAKLREAVAEFWSRVERNDPPPPDFARDGDAIARLVSSDDGEETEIEADEELLRKLDLREQLIAIEKAGRAAADARASIDAELLWRLKNAARGLLPDGRVIEAKTVHRKAYAVAASSYRAVKVKGSN